MAYQPPPGSVLIIQTAFTGDVILATALIEKLHQALPNASIDFLLRKGNESLLDQHPFVRKVIVWDKKKQKIRNLFRIMRQIRREHYDCVVNVQRFASSGLLTIFSGARYTTGFDKNPFSFFFSDRVKHQLTLGLHETERNQKLIATLTGSQAARPKLYPPATAQAAVIPYRNLGSPEQKFFCMAPASVWFTKQFPKEKWISLIDEDAFREYSIFLLGSPADHALCEAIRTVANHQQVINLAGKLSYLESAALMQHAAMNYVNDSAPMHLASAMNAPVTAIYCSTIPAFGFGPLSDDRHIVETEIILSCRPCGLHGHKACPEGHFKCALTITNAQIISSKKIVSPS